MKREGPKPTKKRKREQAKEDAANGGLDRGPMPCLPHDNQRLVGIDPGRRDMIALVSNEVYHGFNEICSSYVRYSKIRKIHDIPYITRVGSSTLYDQLQRLPSILYTSGLITWTTYFPSWIRS
jgi:hypothetical protein